MKKQSVIGHLLPVLADPPHQRGIVPFVHQNEVGTIERLIEIKRAAVVAPAAKHGIGVRKARERRFSVLARQVEYAPRIGRLVDIYIMPASDELAADAAQEVRIAVIPIGDQRVTENYDAHARDSSAKTDEERTPARCDAVSAL
ncbi:MAG TPA: hypothetical protein VGC70_10150, partial [Burkholderiales bacterium]